MNCIRTVSSWLLHVSMVLLALSANGQTSDFHSDFREAVKLTEENEQNMAAQIWTRLAREYPNNGNINYRAGLAHLNAGTNKTASLPYLITAVELGITRNYDRFSPLENKSPVESYYYLGKAYHLNYRLDEAVEFYQRFLDEVSSKHFMRSVAKLGIQQAYNAKKLVQDPVGYEITNLGPVINSEFPDFSPVISVDENALFFTSNRVRPDSSNLGRKDRITGEYFNDIYVSYKNRKGEWQTPELLEINRPDHTATVNVSADGQTLYMYRDDSGIGNIYESKLVGETWTEPVKLGGGINSASWETHIALSIDGESAYFVSNRSGGIGGRDIYRVRKLPTGEWSAAQNLGATINTPYEEDAVFISPDGKTLFFSSEGHTSMGGFDVFYSLLDEKTDNWGPPNNIGYPINTVDDDVFFVTSADGRRAYYSSVKETGYGEKDIYMVKLPALSDVKLALLLGRIFTADGTPIPANLSVRVTNERTNRRDDFTPRNRDGSFVAILPPCDSYKVDYLQAESILATDTFSIACESAYQEIYKELLLNPIRIERDGTATVMRGAEAELIVTTTVADLQPATFKKFYGYNENVVAVEEEIFTNFMAQVKRISETKGTVAIEITASASKVPTRTYGTNEKLAKLRAENAVARVKSYAAKMGIDVSTLKFDKVDHKVGGPDYRGDYMKNQSTYGQFQYIDIVAK